MGIVPLQYLPDQNAESLGLSGKEMYTIDLPVDIKPGQNVTVKVLHPILVVFCGESSSVSRFAAICAELRVHYPCFQRSFLSDMHVAYKKLDAKQTLGNI